MPDAGKPAHDREPDAADRLALAPLPKRNDFLAPHMLWNRQKYWCDQDRSCKEVERKAPGMMPWSGEVLRPLCADLRQLIDAGEQCKKAREDVQNQCFSHEQGSVSWNKHEVEISNVVGVLGHCKSLWSRWDCDKKFKPSELKFRPLPRPPTGPQGPTISPYDPEYD